MKSIRRITSTGSGFWVEACRGQSTRGVPRRTSGVARLALVSAMVLLAMALWWTPADGKEPAEPLWSAEMSVVEYTSVSIGASSADLFANVGGSGNLQIKSLWSHIPDRDLRLAFAEGVANAADYTLQVGGLSLEFPADSSGASSFKWNDVDVDWADGQVIHVRIVLTSDIDALPANTPTPEVSEISETADLSESEQQPQFLVSNLGVNPATGIMRPLNAARPGFAQAFTTGAKTGGYALGSVGIQVSHFSDESTVGDQLRVTINGVAGEGEPGDAVCTLANPSSFSTPGVIAFEAPTGAGSCPQLATETAYFVVIEWLDPSGTDAFALIPQTYPTEETGATGEDPGGAEGWSIADQAYYLSVSSSARTWTAYDETASFKMKVKEGVVAPHAPEGLAAAATQTSITISWQAPAENGGADVTGYQVEWSSDGGDWTELESNTPELSYEHSSLSVGTEYRYRVAAINTAGPSAWAELTQATDPAVAPGAPERLSATATQTSITLSWQAPNENGGADVTGYQIEWSSDGGDWTELEADTAELSYEHSSLSVGTEYRYRVAAINTAGPSAWAELTQATDPAVAPGAPERLSASATQTSITLSWQAPAEDGGTDVTGYQVEWSSDGGDWTELEADTAELSYEHGGLSVGTEYRYRVAALNSAGAGPWAELTQATDADLVADIVADWTATLTVGVHGTGSQTTHGFSIFQGGMGTLSDHTFNEGDRSIDVVAILLSNGFLAFNLSPGPSEDFVLIVDGTEFASADASQVGSPLKISISYVWATTQVWAEDDTVALSLSWTEAEDASQESEAEAVVVPARPSGLSTSATHDSVSLTWNDPSDATITHYQVFRRDTTIHAIGVFITLVDNTGSAATSYTDDSVESERKYVYRVKAVNAQGASPWSSYSSARTPVAPVPVVEADPPPAAEAVAGTVAVWSSTLTVGVHGTGSETTHGYSIFQGGMGTLSEDEFNAGDQSIEVVAMLLSNGFLAFTLNPGPSDDFVLTIDGADYASAAASLVKSTRITSFVWPTTLVWAEDDTVELRIAAPAESAPNSEATGAPEIHGTVQVSRTLSADTSGIVDADGLNSAAFAYQWLADDADISGATGSTYQLTESDEGKVITLSVSFSDDGGHAESLTSEATAAVVDADTCPAAGYDPVAVDLEVEAVPIVVASTTGEYFVLYVRPDLDSDREIPVSLTLGQDGATTLSEQLAALPNEHYRVEKFLIADPADIDGDCIDDITELADPVGLNPLNRAKAISFRNGAVAIPDRETFEALSYKGRSIPYVSSLQDLEFVKFYIVERFSSRPIVYFMNTNTHRLHVDFWRAIGGSGDDRQPTISQGQIVFHPNVVAPNGALGVYRFEFNFWNPHRFGDVSLAYELLAASMPLLENNLAYHPETELLVALYRNEQALYDASRVNVLLAEDIRPDVPFLPMNLGESYGFLREMTPEERPNPRDIVVYATLPNELPRVAGIMTTVPQTPLSHVNLRAVQDSVPNAFIRDALDDDAIEQLIGRYVHYAVTESGYTIRAATPAEVEAHYAASRPAATQVPERDLSVTGITGLDEIGFDDWNAFGVKAANLAVLRTLGFPEGTVPDGFAVPFYFYDEFMKHNDFYAEIEELLADPDFQSDYDTQESELKALRKKIKKGASPQWMIDALTTMHDSYSEGQSLRYRSSTNNEDLPGFSGAGLYDSKTQHAQETADDGIDKSLKQVFASLWNFRAFIERESRNIDHLATAMGVLVHPNFSDELANGVAVSFDPFYETDDAYYVNTQLGEDLVTNPDAFSAPEELLLHEDGSYNVLARSNLVARDQLLMSDAQMEQLRGHLETIHDEFAALYEAEADRPFAMEIEFKITSDDLLSIKQARPWVFPGANRPVTGAPAIDGRAQAGWTLTADISAIGDFDGLSNASFRYQWVSTSESIDTDIEGATDASYEVSDDDVGKTIKVRVTVTDNAGYEETLTSAATVAVAARPNRRATGAPAIEGSAQAGQTLTADMSGIDDVDGLSNAVFNYQWMSTSGDSDVHIADATDSTYAVSDDDVGNTIKVRVIFIDDAGHEEWLTSAPTPTVVRRPNTRATGAPTTDGTAQSGETLTAVISSIDDVDGFDPADFAYRWLSNDGNSDTVIADATDSSYELSDDDVGKTIKVRVTFSDGRDYDESLTSEPTAVVISAEAELPIWWANMQVAEITSVSIGALTADQFSNQGGSVGLQVRQVWYSITERKLRLSFTEAVADADDFTLHVGDLTLEFPAGSSDSPSVSWDDVDVDWEIGETLLVRIIDGATPPATDASSSSGTAQTRSLTDTAPQESTSKDSWKSDAGPERELRLTAEFRTLPASHDGTSTFTFELHFSAEIEAGYARLRDLAFEVTNGNIEKAQRLTRGSNLGWRITVRPDSNADVVLKLPETTDCDAAGAVCTADRQPLSAAVEHTVGGPGS